ncbi:hypothetical protein FRC04_008319 [Tulasnella sp. 424]|nr:hypothetical protein FRC04_008319 [Tulasnella sp. 424]KAG8970292.1 hypothetical protein FRC05_000666 [Tulasnella sp. 425]
MLSRSIKQAVAAPRRLAFSAANQIRCETTSANVPTNVAQAQKKDSHQLVVSEPTEVLTADLNYATALFESTSQPETPCSQGDQWRLNFDVLQGGGRWENPLMGWASSADYVQAMQLKFRTKEDAIHFAEKQGWDYYVQQPTVKRVPPKNYSENYLYSPGKIKIAHTK